MTVRDMALPNLLASYKPGDEHSWQDEADYLWEHDAERILKLAASIQDRGVRRPIVLGGDGRIWDGHHRVVVASWLGFPSVPVCDPSDLVDADDPPAWEGDEAFGPEKPVLVLSRHFKQFYDWCRQKGYNPHDKSRVHPILEIRDLVGIDVRGYEIIQLDGWDLRRPVEETVEIRHRLAVAAYNAWLRSS